MHTPRELQLLSLLSTKSLSLLAACKAVAITFLFKISVAILLNRKYKIKSVAMETKGDKNIFIISAAQTKRQTM